MRVLIACEFSGIVRDAFLARGHDAVSVDLLDTESPGPHIVGDVFDAITTVRPDMMIAHPPCTFLALSGVRWLYGGRGSVRDPQRWTDMEAAALFFKRLYDTPISRIAIENPIMHSYGRALIGGEGPTQTVQPWQFGHPETKATVLWLRGLPLLHPTKIVNGRVPRVHYASPGPTRWKERSRTLTGIADAMADQWGQYLKDGRVGE